MTHEMRFITPVEPMKREDALPAAMVSVAAGLAASVLYSYGLINTGAGMILASTAPMVATALAYRQHRGKQQAIRNANLRGHPRQEPISDNYIACYTLEYALYVSINAGLGVGTGFAHKMLTELMRQ